MNTLELIRGLIAYIAKLEARLDTQTKTIRSLQEYVRALQNSHQMLAASRKFELPPPA